MSVELILTVLFLVAFGFTIFLLFSKLSAKFNLKLLVAFVLVAFIGFLAFSILYIRKSFKNYPETIGTLYGIIIAFDLLLFGFVASAFFRFKVKHTLFRWNADGFVLLCWILLTAFMTLWSYKTYYIYNKGIALSCGIILGFFLLTCILPFYIKKLPSYFTYIDMFLILVFGITFILLAVNQTRFILGNEKEIAVATSTSLLNLFW